MPMRLVSAGTVVSLGDSIRCDFPKCKAQSIKKYKCLRCS